MGQRIKKKPRYRVKKINYIDIWWVVQERVNFLCFNWYKTTWEVDGETSFPLYFKSVVDAKEKLKELDSEKI